MKRLLTILILCSLLVPVFADVRAAAPEASSVQQSRPTLRRESRGDAVRELQRLLNVWIASDRPSGIQALPITGYFGPLTDRVVRSFQGAKNLVVDGIVGPRTWAALDTAPPDRVVPIIDRDSGFLLGAVRGGAWIEDTSAASLVPANVTYRLYDARSARGTITGAKPVQAQVPCESSFQVTPPVTSSRTGTIGVAEGWNPQPRVPQNVALNSTVYRDAVAALLRERGIANPDVRIVALWRIDLDGDGTTEVVMNATRRAEGFLSPSAAAGDYSLVAVRKVVNGRVETMVLDADVHPVAREFNAPQDFELLSALDLNGDGRMELIVEAGYYEGEFTEVYTIDGTTAKVVLSTGCGV